MPLVQIQIVTWNSREHLERLFKGIEQQHDVDFIILIIDNASSDGTIEYLENAKHQIPHIQVVLNKENIGFAKAHNQGFSMCKASYVLVLNPDTELQEGFLKELKRVIGADERIGAVGGKLYLELPKNDKSGIIDSCGLKMSPWGQVMEIGHKTLDLGQYESQKAVFGLTGACVMYRLKALQAIADGHGVFDERFGTYKEDVDLAWRLKKAGWRSVYAPHACCWHRRGLGAHNREQASDLIKRLSIRNHILMLRKNLGWQDWWRMPFIVVYEFAKFIYVALFERVNLKAYRIAKF